ncbi:MAG: hypothetical protein ACRD1Z_23130, partial [Vicinamibacteria bacterium]
MLVQNAVTTLVIGALAPGMLALFLRLSPSIDLELGPGDRDYAHGFSDRFRFDGEETWRRLEGRARAALPVSLEGEGTLTIAARSLESSSSVLTIRFDDGTAASVTVPKAGDGHRSLRWEIPRSRVRAHVRLRTEGGPLEVGTLRWQSARFFPDRSLALAAGLLGALSYLAFAVAGLRARDSLAAVVVVFAALGILARFDGFAAVHLVARLAWVAGLGVVLVGLARLFSRNAAPAFRALVYATLLFKGSLLFHPSFYFFDWPIHETLLELLYHRGAQDFLSRLVDYQLAHNLG